MCKIKAVKKAKGYTIEYYPNFERKVIIFMINEFMKGEIPIINLDYRNCNISNRNINISIYRIASMLNKLKTNLRMITVVLPDTFEPLFKGDFVIWDYINDDKAKRLEISDLKGVI